MLLSDLILKPPLAPYLHCRTKDNKRSRQQLRSSSKTNLKAKQKNNHHPPLPREVCFCSIPFSFKLELESATFKRVRAFVWISTPTNQSRVESVLVNCSFVLAVYLLCMLERCSPNVYGKEVSINAPFEQSLISR